jgi:hypothetical protein
MGVMLVRGMWLYSADIFLITVTAMMIFLLCRHIAMILARNSGYRVAMEVFSLLPAAVVAIGIGDIIANELFNVDAMFLPVMSTVWALLSVEVASRCAGDGAGYRRFAAIVLMLGMLANLMIFASVAMAAICLGLGLALMVYGYVVEQQTVFGMGIVILLAGLGYQLHFAIEFFNLGSWTSLAALGVTAILAGSVLERHGRVIKHRLLEWGGRFRDWQL